MDTKELAQYLEEHGFIDDDSATEIIPLDGGVSSAIYVVKTPARSFVVKQALEKLRVSEEWHCDITRNLYEQEFMALAQEIMPGSVPRLIHCDRNLGLFLMEYLDEGWTTWKTRLWNGELSVETAERAGQLLGAIHHHSWMRNDVARRFESTALFHQLRIEPYLLTASKCHPEVADIFLQEAERLAQTRLSLVHGDYSPKNLMTDGKSLKILDAEVAWFGDPAFDVAFLSTHLWLKAVRFPERARGYLKLQSTFLEAYRGALAGNWSEDVELRAARLLLMLLIARVSGKSPAGYFTSNGPEENFILKYAISQMREPQGDNPFNDLSQKLIEDITLENFPR